MSESAHITGAFTRIAARYEQVVDGELRRFWGWSYAGFVANLVDQAGLDPAGRILDLATGTGVIPFTLAARGLGQAGIVGLDLTYAMLARARQRQPRGARLVCANAMAVPFAPASFDGVTCGLATHHLDVSLLLAEIFRLLRPGGRLAIADVAGAAAWRRPPLRWLLGAATFLYFWPKEGYARARAEAGALDHVLTPTEWQAGLVSAGFCHVRVEEIARSRPWAPAPVLIRAARPV